METDINSKEEDTKEDIVHWEWASTIAEGIPPSARGGHSATLIGKSIVIFGGHYYSDKNIGFVYLNDTHFLDVALSKWLKPYCTGKIPPPRYGHSAIYAGGIIIVFGGKGPKNTIYNDLYTFDPDPEKYAWLLANETGEAPSPRFNHSANLWSTSPLPRQGHASCVVGHNLIIQGGFYFDDDNYKNRYSNYGTFLKSCYLNDIKLLDLKLNAWAQLRTNGQPPQPRFGHTISFVNDQLIIFGGWSCNSGRRFNAMSNISENAYVEETDYFYSLNTLTLTWQKCKFNGDLPTNRYGHTATVIRQNIIYFGGWEFGKALNDINILLAK